MDDEQLIECVRNYEFLYNLQHPKNMDTIKKEVTWKRIADQMKQPAVACKQRWQCLRDSYRRSLRKKKGTSGMAARNIKKWKYEDEMSFLIPFLSQRKALDSVEFTSDNEEDPENESREIDLDNNLEKLESRIDHATAVDSIYNSHTDEERFENSERSNKPKKAIKRLKTVQTASAVLMAKLLDDQNKLAPPREHDELDRFFLSISDTVKKFPLYQQALSKIKIFSLVSGMELQLLAPSTSTSAFQ